MPMGMTYSTIHRLGVLCSHISVGFLLFILLGGQCEGLELRISNSRSALCYVVYRFFLIRLFFKQSSGGESGKLLN